MSREHKEEADLWDSETPQDRLVSDPDFLVDIDGFEGPLDLLLTLARSQKVDLARISVLDLAIQYLEFVERARKLRLELAADYLVMAAWLAYLKSRLLLPEPEKGPEPSGEELAARLAFRLQRLDAMRAASTALMNRNRLGRDVFQRGAPEPVVTTRTPRFEATLHDLLSAYAQQRQRVSASHVTITERKGWSLQDARAVIERLMGKLDDWTALDRFMTDYLASPEERASVIASSFAASLELVREGVLEVRQDAAFGALYLRTPQAGIPAAQLGRTI